MSATFCGSPVCGVGVQVFIADPADPLVREPCPRCVDALADTLQVVPEDKARTMRSVHNVIAGRL